MTGLWRLLSILIFGVLAAVSIMLTRQNISDADVTAFAQKIDQPSEMDPDLFRAHLDLIGSGSSSVSCRSDLLRPLFNVRMNELDFFYGHEDLSKSLERLTEADAFLRRFLECVPTEGNVLALDALVVNTIRRGDPRIYKLLSLSQFYAPSQSNIVEMRVKLLMSLAWQGDKNLETMLDRDLLLMASYFKVSALQRFVAIAPADVRQKLKDFVSTTPLDRQVDLMDVF